MPGVCSWFATVLLVYDCLHKRVCVCVDMYMCMCSIVSLPVGCSAAAIGTSGSSSRRDTCHLVTWSTRERIVVIDVDAGGIADDTD